MTMTRAQLESELAAADAEHDANVAVAKASANRRAEIARQLRALDSGEANEPELDDAPIDESSDVE
jgi:hypothetical protein